MNTRITLPALLLLLSGCGITGGDEVTRGRGPGGEPGPSIQRGNYEAALAARSIDLADGRLRCWRRPCEGQGWCQSDAGPGDPGGRRVPAKSLLADDDPYHGARAGEAFARRDSSHRPIIRG
jgi:hypothetical protein